MKGSLGVSISQGGPTTVTLVPVGVGQYDGQHIVARCVPSMRRQGKNATCVGGKAGLAGAHPT